MTKFKGIYLLLSFISVFVGGLLLKTDASAYFNPQEKQSTNGNWMQCYALQYKKDTASGTFTGGDFKSPTVTVVVSTKRLCAYVDGDGKLLTGNVELFSEPAGTGTMPESNTGKFTDTIYNIVGNLIGEETEKSDYRNVYLSVKDNKVSLNQFTTNNADTDCANEVAKTWTVSKGDNFESLAKKINNTAHQKYAGFEKMAYNSNGNTGSETQETSQNISYDDEGEDGESNSACYKNSGALGWVLCPLISNIADALGAVYDSMVEPFLVIEPELLQGDGVYTAWDIFRNFANIAFVILFLVVIFSQLTGTGIDNYGIKRMLPKLIVAAVLINLSYVICQLAVDVSNILGNSLNSLFIDIAERVNASAASPADFFSSTVTTVGTVLGVGVGAGAAFVTFSAAIASGFALIIPILATVISAIIAVLFMFVILFVRKAIVILLVAVAPIAFVTYIMPNTKRLIFDKWLNIFKGALLLYPLAGALIGGGLLASAVIISALGTSAESGNAGLQEFFMYIGALLIQVVPFFFLPTLFRRSLAAMGNVGERLGRMGTQLGAGAGRRFRENEGVQMAQAGMAAGRQGGLRQRVAQRMPGFMGRNGMARSRMRYQKMLSDQGSLNAMYGEDYLLGTQTANVMKELEASGEINDSRALQRGLQDALSNGDRARIRAYTDALSAKGDSGRDAVKAAYNAVAPRISQTSAETFAANIMANHAADYKNNNRSLFDVANGINNGNITRGANGYQTTGQYVGTHKNQLQTSAKAETMAAMDDSAFAEAFLDGDYENGTINNLNGLSPEERDAVGANAYRALQNTTNMKADRVARLRQVLQQSGYQPPAQDVHVV